MARDVTAAVAAQLAAFDQISIYLARFEFDSGTLRFWSGYGDLSWNSETWTGGGKLVSFTPVRETREIQSAQMAFQLDGVDAAIVSIAMNENYQDRPMALYRGCLDNTGAIVANPFVIFAGRMDIMDIVDDGETATITITCENRNVDFEKTPGGTYTHEDQQSRYSGDKFFEFQAGLRDRKLRWGYGQ